MTYLRRTAADGTAYLDTWWGRYLDEYECRDGRWAISHRVCVHEWTRSERRRGADADRRATLPAGRCGPRLGRVPQPAGNALMLLPLRAACYVPFYTSPVVTGDAGPNVGGDCGEGARMRKIEHALSGAVYEWAEDDLGPVLVTDRKGRQGRFDRDGRWVTGEVRRADPELCRWIASGGRTAGGAASRSRRFEVEETFS